MYRLLFDQSAERPEHSNLASSDLFLYDQGQPCRNEFLEPAYGLWVLGDLGGDR